MMRAKLLKQIPYFHKKKKQNVNRKMRKIWRYQKILAGKGLETNRLKSVQTKERQKNRLLCLTVATGERRNEMFFLTSNTPLWRRFSILRVWVMQVAFSQLLLPPEKGKTFHFFFIIDPLCDKRIEVYIPRIQYPFAKLLYSTMFEKRLQICLRFLLLPGNLCFRIEYCEIENCVLGRSEISSVFKDLWWKEKIIWDERLFVAIAKKKLVWGIRLVDYSTFLRIFDHWKF